MQRRGLTTFLLLVAGLTLYILGYWQGQAGLLVPQAVTDSTVPFQQHTTEQVPATHVIPPSASVVQGFNELLSVEAWFQLERWLVNHRAELTTAHGAQLAAVLASKVNKYDAVSMRRVLRAYLDAVPGDTVVMFLLSDLQQIGGMREAALETLFSILDYPPDEESYVEAARGAEQIINVIDNELKNRGALAEREAFWRHISQRIGSSDNYRYRWASSLAELKQWDQARRVLSETGTSNVSQQALDDLLAHLDIAEQGLQFETDGDHMVSSVRTPEGLSLTLLVDTGASVTSLSKDALRSVAAERQNRKVRIRTASGIVTTAVYKVAELEVQGKRFTDLTVIELSVDLPGLDGLLGLDILNQLTENPLDASR